MTVKNQMQEKRYTIRFLSGDYWATTYTVNPPDNTNYQAERENSPGWYIKLFLVESIPESLEIEVS